MRAQLYNGSALAARVALSALFIDSAVGKLADPNGVAQALRARGVPAPELAGGLAATVEMTCGLALLLGAGLPWTSLGLALFTLVATLLFHDFWRFSGAEFEQQKIHALKNLGLLGGLLMLTVHGPGRLSVDAWLLSARSARLRQKAAQ